MAFLTAEEAKKKADNSDLQYRILRYRIFTRIECAANEGKYKLQTIENTDYSLAVRLAEELRSCGYWVDYCSTYPIAPEGSSECKDTTFNISWKI